MEKSKTTRVAIKRLPQPVAEIIHDHELRPRLKRVLRVENATLSIGVDLAIVPDTDSPVGGAVRYVIGTYNARETRRACFGGISAICYERNLNDQAAYVIFFNAPQKTLYYIEF